MANVKTDVITKMFNASTKEMKKAINWLGKPMKEVAKDVNDNNVGLGQALKNRYYDINPERMAEENGKFYKLKDGKKINKKNIRPITKPVNHPFLPFILAPITVPTTKEIVVTNPYKKLYFASEKLNININMDVNISKMNVNTIENKIPLTIPLIHLVSSIKRTPPINSFYELMEGTILFLFIYFVSYCIF